ncbi:MAG: hypothetical protein ABIL20_02780, partial [candidate division WOR-3 bacterium]
MATVPLEKFVIIVHKSIKEQFVDRLHKLKIIHITDLRETPVYTPVELERIKEAISQIAGFQKKGMLDNFVSPRIPMKLDDFQVITRKYDFQRTAKELEQIKNERETLNNQLQNLKSLVSTLIPFEPLKYKLSESRNFKQVEAIFVQIKSEEVYKTIESSITDIPFSFEPINKTSARIFGLFFVRKVDLQKFKGKLIELGCEIIELPNIDKTPADLISEYNQQIEKIDQTIAELNQKELKLAQEIMNLKIVYDWIENEFRKNGVAEALPETSSTINIIGWIKKKDIEKLNKIAEEFKFVAFE